MAYRFARGTATLGVGLVFLLLAIAAHAADAAASAPAAAASVPDADLALKAITQIAQTALAYAAVLTAAGTVAMAFVELIKAVFDLRQFFQRSRLNRWLGKQKDQVLPELLYLAIGDKDHESVLCGQPIEKLMGQLQAAARIALDYPEKFPKLFAFLTSSDLESGAPNAAPATVAPADRTAWKTHAQAVHNISAHLAAVVPSVTAPSVTAPPPPAQSASDAAQAKARLASLVGRKLDGFQLRTEYWWSRFNQALSMVISVGVVWIAAQQGLHLSQGEALAVGFLGGLLAPFAKDFSQSLAKFAAK